MPNWDKQDIVDVKCGNCSNVFKSKFHKVKFAVMLTCPYCHSIMRKYTVHYDTIKDTTIFVGE